MLTQFPRSLRADVKKNMEADTTFDFDAVEPASSEAVLKAQLSNSHITSDPVVLRYLA